MLQMNDFQEKPDTGNRRYELVRLLAQVEFPRLKLQTVCDYLHENMKQCDWAGYYLVDMIRTQEADN